ncbi:MAG: GMC family oxidoreductase [Gemmatimonadetes bacterium]|nr:GMC family oxidoreductase [Gemmatimonadota bacterium]
MTDLDWRRGPAGALEAEFVVIGAGPAGLSVAHRLARTGRRLILVDSGESDPTAHATALNDGTVSGDGYAGLTSTRHRQLGGTAAIWNTPYRGRVGAKYLRLDRSDLSARVGDLAGWPIDFATLLPWYREAERLCGLEPQVTDGADNGGGGDSSAVGSGLVTRWYRWGPRDAWTDGVLGELRRSGAATVLGGVTVVRLELGDPAVVELVARDPAGVEWRLRAQRVVIATGAIEAARLLLTMPLGGTLSWLGRGFMEHPRDRTLALVPRGPDLWHRLTRFDLGGDPPVAARLALSDQLPDRADWANASVSLFPRWRPGWLARWRGRRGTAGYGWSDRPRPERAFDRIELVINTEQFPHPGNRVSLGGSVDRHGIPKPHLHWEWRTEDQRRLDRVKTLVAQGLQAAGWGTVVVTSDDRPDPNAHHHAGTTRMAIDPRDGVVDANGRVFGTDRLYLAGASVFPRAGFANPTLTIAALGLRLGDHLADGA